MKLVRLVDFGITHVVVGWPDEPPVAVTGRTWCGQTFPVHAHTYSDGDPECKSCLRCLAGQLGPGDDDCTRLVNAFPAVFLRSFVYEAGPDVETRARAASLTGYLHTSMVEGSVTDVHGHYVGPREEGSVIHEHKGGRRVHDHVETK